VISQEILKNKEIKAVGKLIIHFLSEIVPANDGGIKTNMSAISDGIGETYKSVKNHIEILKSKGILKIKGGRYPVFYLKIPISPHRGELNDSISPHRGELKPHTYINNVVVVLLKKYGFDFGPIILEKLSRFSVSDQIRAIESTRAYAKSNPARYIERILDNDCKGIRLPDKQEKDPYAADRERLRIEREKTLRARQAYGRA
jgi:hypothetical protein